tara:strand:+ start:866 stop:1600 length:735 start_codon:yes stop_codon:yes gene_type:complete
MINKRIIYFLLILTSSCAVKKYDVSEKKHFFPKNQKELVEKVYEQNNNYSWIRLKGSVSVKKENGEKTSLNTVIKIKNDSLIWASVSAPFGVELFRVMITQDSVYYMSHLNKDYFIKPIIDIEGFLKIKLRLTDIQSLITGEMQTITDRYNFSNHLSLISKKRSYFIDPDKYRIKSTVYTENEYLLDVKYFYLSKNVNFSNFPNKIEITGNIDQTIIITYNKLIFDEKQKIVFNIPKSYANNKN